MSEDQLTGGSAAPSSLFSLAQMNQFQVLAQVFRHNKERHSGLTRIVAGLVKRRVAQRPLKTYPVA